MDYRMRIIIEFMQRDLNRDLDVRCLASIIGISPSGLRRLFKKNVGIPPHRFLKRLRLERARQLLCSKTLSVKEVSGVVGCLDESHFVRDFERTYGLSPAKYRQAFFGRMPNTVNHANQ